ncbi:MAG: DUF1684 domain-containing protein [Chloroflexota bacterium]
MTEPIAADYLYEIERWHAERDARLRSPDGWLALVGLHWLTPGEHEIGQHPSNAIRLSGRGVPPLAGHLLVTDDLQASIRPHHGAQLTHDGPLIDHDLPLVAEPDGEPTVIELGSLRMHLIRRGVNRERLGLRVRDREAPALAAFTGVPRFPVDPAWRLTGRLVQPPQPRTIAVPDIVGDVLEEASPGDVVLPLPGGEQRLQALEQEDQRLWLIFGDATNGHQTYAAGRFLVTGPVAADGSVVVDFNLAYNMPCVFSSYATCPLPPIGNHLTIRIPAGEILPLFPNSG